MSKIDTPHTITDLPIAIIKNMITLATSGFGVVVALAWNEAIKNTVDTYIDPYLGENSGVISLFIYALIVTVLAILVTMQLSNLEKKFTDLDELIKTKSGRRKIAEAEKEKK